MGARRRYTVVGAGARAETFVRSLVTAHADQAELAKERGTRGRGCPVDRHLFSGRALELDPLGRRATEIDGALAVLTGLAANASAAQGRPYDVAELIDPNLLKES